MNMTCAVIHDETNFPRLYIQLGPSPVPALGVISNGVIRSHSDPGRNRSILLQRLAELLLCSE